MRIHRLRLANYRGVDAAEVTFAPTGVTVVQGPNEAGKTSLAEALDLLLDHYDDTQKAAVRAVKPLHRDAGAEITAELSAGPYRFTYTKRFHKDRATTLTVHEPAPASHTGREAHDAVQAMLRETVDLALWRAQRLAQDGGVEQADLREQTALARSLDRSAAGLAAGDREDTLHERVLAEYRRYHTATGRPSKEVKEAVADHEAATHDADLARKHLDEVEADVQRCTALERDLAACRTRGTGHQRRLPDLEAAWSQLSARRQEVHRLALAAELAEATRATPAGLLQARHDLAADVQVVGAALAELRGEQSRAAPAAAIAERARDQAEREVAERSAALRDAQDQAVRARAAYERRRDRLDLELLAERAERVTDAQHQVAQAEAALDRARVDAALLARIEAAHLAVVEAEARLHGDHTVVAVRPLGAGPVEVGGRQVTDEQTLAVTAPLDVTVPGVVAVSVRPGRGVAALAAARDTASSHLAACLGEAGVGDVAAARAAQRRREEAQRARADAHDALRRDLRDLTPDLLADKVRRLRERVGDVDLDTDLDGAREAVEQAEGAVATATEALTDAEQMLARAASEREGARHTRAELEGRVEAATARLQERSTALADARTEAADATLAGRADAAGEQAAAAARAYADAAADLDAADPDAVRAALDNARDAAERATAEARRLEHELLATRARLEVRGEEGLADRLAAAESRVARTGFHRERTQARAAAARLLYDTMTCRRDQARQAYVAPFRDKITALGRVVFGPDLAVTMDEDLAITSRTLHGVTVPFADLSAGAREQLAVIARLACAAITSDDGGVPLLLDDALGHSDPARLEALGAVFTLAGRDAQVIVLTCTPERYQHIGTAHIVRLP